MDLVAVNYNNCNIFFYMKKFFEAYKGYIINHPKTYEYKPTSKKYDHKELSEISEKLDNNIPRSEEDDKAIDDFVKISDLIHNSYVGLYKKIKDNYCHLNLDTCDIAEYIVAGLNREYKVIWDQYNKTLNKAENRPYNLSDILNFKVESPVPGIGFVDVRAALESATEACGLQLNYLRHLLGETLTLKDFKPEEFVGRIIHSMQISQRTVVVKHSYDDILYNGGFVNIDEDNKSITFDYENHDNLRLLVAGNMMFSERRMQVLNHSHKKKITPRLYRYITTYRIKTVNINRKCVTLKFAKGESKEHKQIVSDMQSAIDAYYDFLVGDTKLPKLADCTIDEAISIWCAIQYIAQYVLFNAEFDILIKTREDFSLIPSKIRKKDLISYVKRLTNIEQKKISATIGALEASLEKFNNIWTSMLYPIEDYYLLPFYPIICSVPYNIIDFLMERGGFCLEERGKQFENYIYKQLTEKGTKYPITCRPVSKYGENNNNNEEIDVLVSMKNVVFVADAKCIHYSMDPINYAEAWKRLVEGCEQVIRKTEFVKKNSQYFEGLGDYSSKTFINFVITNYPTFTGFSHKGVYVIDCHSFLSYMQNGVMALKQLTLDCDSILYLKNFYNNEDQYSDNFIKYLSKNPIKNEFLNRINIVDLPLMVLNNSWSIFSKSAQINNDPKFNINKG